MADDPKDKELKVDNVLTRDLQTSTYQASHKDEYVKEIVVDWSNVVDMMLDAKKKVDADTTAVADFKAGIVNKKNILLTTAGQKMAVAAAQQLHQIRRGMAPKKYNLIAKHLIDSWTGAIDDKKKAKAQDQRKRTMKLNAEQLDPSFLPADVKMAISTMGYAGNIYKLNGRLYDEDMVLIGSKKSRGNLKGQNLQGAYFLKSYNATQGFGRQLRKIKKNPEFYLKRKAVKEDYRNKTNRGIDKKIKKHLDRYGVKDLESAETVYARQSGILQANLDSAATKAVITATKALAQQLYGSTDAASIDAADKYRASLKK